MKEVRIGGEGAREGEKMSPLCSQSRLYVSIKTALTAFRLSSTQYMVPDWALSNSHQLIPHQQAQQHIIDMPKQMDATASLFKKNLLFEEFYYYC